ncbi:GDSL esterase/lipase At1g28670 isoform X1 [Arabidopsis lyrata subsp. lyrata]|uniref:GDSL esterase/lipase At1g28670 isoform X1 n=1 Tax=Arabidopsis lyrata subsp. lyrata TaxID=81972 RepID=UPI000A29BA26|nr:GDSL esterase/lipase At1g28670 isoform X1 [Arabidopsis lyrata subsp. lyrata]|eukprot:XP_020870416.1 GDSL esterase/lipase At1g28670 isoform X1 [Arabidopsis lyrata subsp. lyrata]
MASSLKKLISSFLLVLYYTTIIVASSESRCRRFKSIISFGDSIADTGNYLHLSDVNHLPQTAFLPYGESFFHLPSGRASDGRLIIDFIAEFLGLPYVMPYFGSQNVSFEQGINFAVYGATALDRAFLVGKGIESDFTNVSLSVQLDIFKQILPNLCASSTRDCKEILGDSLILMGEIGGNDYNYPFFEGKSINEIKELVPLIIKAISSAIVVTNLYISLPPITKIITLYLCLCFNKLSTNLQDLIALGGKTFLVPGGFPAGCSAAYLTLFQTVAEKDHDPFTGCIPWLNEFGEHHNKQLKTELERLQKLYPHVNIIYADYHNTLYRFYQEPAKYGFKKRPLAACCGVGGQYNFTIGKECGYEGVSYCQNPSEYVNWDGYHLTEAAYKKMAEGILNGPYAIPSFDWSCLGSGSVDKEYSFSS